MSGDSPSSTIKLFFVVKMFYFILIYVHEKCSYIISRCLKENYVGGKKVIASSKAFKYPHYKKFFIDENPKTGFLDMKKIQKVTKK